MRRGGGAASLLSVVMLAGTGTLLAAQPAAQGYGEHHGGWDWNGWNQGPPPENAPPFIRHAFHEGMDAGRHDRDRGRPDDPERALHHHGVEPYQQGYGEQGNYRHAYMHAFRRGYQDGYHGAHGYGPRPPVGPGL